VTAIAPHTGWVDVTTDVTITGTGFQPWSRALLDGLPTDTSFVSATALIVRMLPREVGTVEIAVENPGGGPVKAPQPFAYVETPLVTFSEPGFSTADVRDASGQIVRFDQAGRLILTADASKLAGFRANGLFIPAEDHCACWLEVRFGTENGQRRAYLTADWGHDNPGTLIRLDIIGHALVVSKSQVYPPGSYTLSGVVTEVTAAGVSPVVGASVEIIVGGGWRVSVTDVNGEYAIPGLYDSSPVVHAFKAGYLTSKQEVRITGDTRYDIGLVAR
jgi:hypothetical protein